MELDIQFSSVLFYGSAALVSVFLAVCAILIAISSRYPIIMRSRKEKYFMDPNSGKFVEFPSIYDNSSIHLSVIIPAYNEEVRLSPMLDECVAFLEDRAKDGRFKYEIIVVSDGSVDNTVLVAKKYCKQLGVEKFRILELETNRGKGGAVRLGMLSARGALLLFADADGATKFMDLSKLELSLKNELTGDYLEQPEVLASKTCIVVGSRAHLQSDAVAQRSLFRTILMHGFHTFVWMFTVRDIKDTQCGFKLFTRKAAVMCFDSLHVERWAFDAELLFIAKKLHIPVTEVAVNWTEIEGSKLVPIWSWLQMGKDLFVIWLRYQIGAWDIAAQKKE
ncbi:hypothetical protein PPYR_06645 [Photinus pyralis]|uniref:Dolichyl-phosphate beta-glucosyltransferase n=1 Tax=Photinus pyralis TaxID=7054 RepID=A0A1Y1K4B3_PHOPY|nr:dolichyl-phosphate beta-glucosyltransferase-like isoform X1 [Photinus pyralis]KAB0798765.1 hypothetical protein PPYR_06645 [Photinus pyralis]